MNPVAIDGRLEWREWEAQDGTKRQAVEVIADTVQFLGGRSESAGEPANQFVPAGATAAASPRKPAMYWSDRFSRLKSMNGAAA